MTTIKFHITEERKRLVSLRAMIALQALEKGRTPDMRGLRDLLAVFLVDDNGGYLPKEQATDAIEELDLEGIEQAGQALSQAMSENELPKPRKKRST